MRLPRVRLGQWLEPGCGGYNNARTFCCRGDRPTMIWDDSKIVAVDLETSGKITHEVDGTPMSAYALQPWRVARGDAWITSASAVRHMGASGLRPHLSQLFPQREQLKHLLEESIANGWTLLGWNIAFDIAFIMSLGPDIEDLCMRASWLDGMLLERHYDIEPEYEFATARHKKKSYALKGTAERPGAMQRWLPHTPLHNDGVKFHSTEPDDLARLQRYNDLDNVYTWVIAKMIWDQLLPAQRRAAMIEAEALPVVAQANLRGLAVDRLTVRHLSAKLDNDAAALLAELAPDGVTEKIVRSPVQLGNLMFDEWKLPVLKTNKSKVEGKADSRSTDKEVLHELAFVDPRVAKVKNYRGTLNAKGKFCTSVLESLDYNDNQHVHPTANVFSTYCVPGSVEVLTRNGWEALHSWVGGDIMQAAEDGTMRFLPAERFVGPETSEWVQINHARLDGLFTPGHTMPHIPPRGGWATVKAGEMLAGTDRALPVAGHWVEGGGGAAEARVLAMVQADGCFRSDGAVSLCFEKPRKQQRARALLDACGVRYTVQTSKTRPGRETFYIPNTERPIWLTPERKVFGPWLLGLGAEALRALVGELEHWDGSPHIDGGFRYTTSIEENQLWAATAAALVGVRASAHAQNADGMFSAHFSEGPPTVTIRPSRHCSTVNLPLRAYCATTQTGYWLARSGRHVFITGNTGRMTVSSQQGKGKHAAQIGFALHQMKREVDFREIVTVDDGYDLVEFDAAGQEFRWMAVASGDTTMLNLCLPGEDAHSFMGARIVGMDYHELVRRNSVGEEVAKQNRYLGKFANLCIAEGTMILTDRGPCSIELVRDTDLVWDGEKFVTHDGVRFSGVFPVISYQGVTGTPDHKVLVDGSWVQLQEAARHGWRIECALGAGRTRPARAAIRIVGGLVRRTLREVRGSLCAGALRLWDGSRCEFAFSRVREIYPLQGLRDEGAARPRRRSGDSLSGHSAAAESGQRVVPAVPEPEGQVLAQLRRAWDRVPFLLGARGGGICPARVAAPDLPQAGHRPGGQRWSLRSWKLALGLAQGEPGEPQPVCCRTFDIINCGPDTRFSANGVIVHNSLQYRTSARKLRSKARVDYDIPLEMPEALRIHSTYQRSYPGVPVYWDRQIAIVKSCGYVETFGGNRIKVVGDWNGKYGWSMGSTAINARIQGTGADQKHLAIAVLKDYLRQVGGKFLFDLHDGAYFAIPSSKSLAFCHRAKYMLDNLPYKEAWGFTPPIPMPWDCKIGKVWGRLKEVQF